MVSKIPDNANPAVNQKIPETPIKLLKTGPATKDKVNDMPMLMPKIAIARERDSSLVKSASRAITAAEIAPVPCKALPKITPQIDSDIAATKLPKAKTAATQKNIDDLKQKLKSRPKVDFRTVIEFEIPKGGTNSADFEIGK